MDIRDERIDGGRAFDFGRASKEYALYRDIYPGEFYRRIVERGLCVKGQNVLDIGTGTGVLPRNMACYGARWTGTDISPEQISEARRLSEEAGLSIDLIAAATEELSFANESFDVITACQCFWYFDHEKVIPKLFGFLKPDGRLVILYMAWLPYEDPVAGASEELVLKYSPSWSGVGEKKHPIEIPEAALSYFEVEYHEEYDLEVPFTRESWHGRMRACRGVGASLSGDELLRWDREHRELLSRVAPESFAVKHYAAMAVLKKKRGFYGGNRAPEEVKRLYDRLRLSWSAETCAPRLRGKWSKTDPTCGQCSVTAFLAQDILGGEVLGIPRPDGNYHCFNVIDGEVYDLTSEQFGDEKLDYASGVPQLRETHFAKEEKKERYLLLKKLYEETEAGSKDDHDSVM